MHALKALGLAALIVATPAAARAQTVPAGTPITVRLDERLSTGHVQRGTHWNGTVARPVVVSGRTVIPAGSAVDGVVTSAAEGTHHTKASMSLAIRSVRVHGETRSLTSRRSWPIRIARRRSGPWWRAPPPERSSVMRSRTITVR